MVFWGAGVHTYSFGNFLKAVRGRSCRNLNADIEEGHQSSALCHLGNISYQLGVKSSFAEAGERLQQLALGDDVVATLQRTERHLESHGIDLDAELNALQLSDELASILESRRRH